MSHLAVLMFAFAGFTALCAAMGKHQFELLGERLPAARRDRLRLLGWIGLALALACSVSTGDWRFRTVEWVGAIMLGALALTLLITYRPRWARPAAVTAGGLAAALWLGAAVLG